MNPTPKTTSSSQLDAYAVSLRVIRSLRTVVAAIGRRDKELEKQTRKAASSIALNVKEGARRRGSDRRYHFSVAAGSADEVVGCLEVAEAWGYTERGAIAEPLALLDRVLAMLHRLAG